MPALAEGLMLGAGDMFNQELVIVTQKSDDESTVFNLSIADEKSELPDSELSLSDS